MGKQLNVQNSVISANDDALLYNAFNGMNGVYNYGNRLDYDIVSNNEINIKDGMVTAQGRNYVIYPNDIDTLEIENGTQLLYRHDLIVYEVNKNGENEELCIKVLKGVASANPQDAELTQGDTLASGTVYQLPLYRVRLYGSNIVGVDDLRQFIPTKADLKAVNSNLLINANFKNVVNQREVKTYDSGESTRYTVDRWLKRGTGTSVIVGANYLRVKCYAQSTISDLLTGLNQPIEDIESLKGKTITLSCKVNAVNGNGMWSIGLRSTTNGAQYSTNIIGEVVVVSKGVFSCTMDIPEDFSDTYLLVSIFSNQSTLGVSKGDYIDLEYIKLEVGRIATEHQPRNISDELLLCNRYYYKVGGSKVGASYNDGSKRPYVAFTLPNNLRTTPTLTFNGTIYVYDSKYNASASGWSYSKLVDNQLIIKNTSMTCGVVQGGGSAYLKDDASIMVDAEIY